MSKREVIKEHLDNMMHWIDTQLDTGQVDNVDDIHLILLALEERAVVVLTKIIEEEKDEKVIPISSAKGRKNFH